MIKARSSGVVRFETTSGDSYTVNVRVETPKAQKRYSRIKIQDLKKEYTLSDLFATTINSGTLRITGGNGEGSYITDNRLIVPSLRGDVIKLEYAILNKKYRMKIRIVSD